MHCLRQSLIVGVVVALRHRLDQSEGDGREDSKNCGDLHLLVSVEVELNDFVNCL